MKKVLAALVVTVGLLYACEKENVSPDREASFVSAPVSSEKETGNTKEQMYCETRNNGTLIANGLTCKGSGNQCGRKDRCSTGLLWGQDPDEIVFEDMTRQKFIDEWNTDEGMKELMEKGVYVVTHD